MSDRLIVLKLGGSLIPSEQAVHQAAAEVQRWIRRGYKVLAVISALKGQTETLLTQSRTFVDDPDPHAQAMLLATGELTAAALLALSLRYAGTPVEALDTAGIGLRTTDDPLNADPLSVDHDAVRSAFKRAPVLVVPGFIGRDEHNRVTLLGRGGSDFTALFLAHHLRATRCRLVKDVDGLYEHDPRSDGPKPRRYAAISWSALVGLGSKVVQPKSARYAEQHHLRFEVSGLLKAYCTKVGGERSRLVQAEPGTVARAAWARRGLENGTVGEAAA